MKLGSKVLVATDFSDAADEAVRQGHEEAAAAGGELVACHIVPNLLRQSPLFPQVYTGMSADVVRMQQSALEALEARITAVTGRDPSAFRIVVDTGGPDAGIIRVADEVRATLVVVGSRGATGLDKLLLGSVAERVVRYAHCPVLVARPHEKTGRVLAATDFSEAVGPAIEVAAQEARRRGTRLTLLHSLDILPSPALGWGVPFGASWVVPPKEIIDQAQAGAKEALDGTLQRLGIEGDVRAVQGDAATAILEAARMLPAELVVVATRGRTGIARMVLGSVAEKVVAHAHCSVLAMRLSG